MRLLCSSLALVLAGCAFSPRPLSRPHTESTFSIRILTGAFTGPIKSTTGWFFYVEDRPPFSGPFLEGYRVKDDKVVEYVSAGSAGGDYVRLLEAIDLEPFDWKAEIAEISARLDAEAAKRGERSIPPIIMDGAEYEISILTKRGTFTLRAWNPGPLIDYYATYSPKVAKLKRYIDTIAQYKGPLNLGI